MRCIRLLLYERVLFTCMYTGVVVHIGRLLHCCSVEFRFVGGGQRYRTVIGWGQNQNVMLVGDGQGHVMELVQMMPLAKAIK